MPLTLIPPFPILFVSNAHLEFHGTSIKTCNDFFVDYENSNFTVRLTFSVESVLIAYLNGASADREKVFNSGIYLQKNLNYVHAK